MHVFFLAGNLSTLSKMAGTRVSNGVHPRQVEEVDDEMHLLKMKPRILGGQIAKARCHGRSTPIVFHINRG